MRPANRIRSLALVFVFAASTLHAQAPGPLIGQEEDSVAGGSFGLGNQDLFVPAFAFRPEFSSSVSMDHHSLGYYFMNNAGNAIAPLSLPAGARITVVTCYFFDNDNDPLDFAVVNLKRFTYNTSTDVPLIESVDPAVASADTGGYQRVFESFDETIEYRPSLFTRRFYGLEATLPASSEVRFRGCNVTWQRQVSPAPATATFTDVPVSHPYHRFVEALADSGITAGCAPSLYCVNNPITRGEMAVFLAVALGLHFPF